MAIDAGRMRNRIYFQRRSEEKGKEDEWTDVKWIFAEVKPLSAREIVSQVREVVITHKILCRYASGIDQKMRIRWGSRFFRIISIINYDERCTDMTIMVEELTNGRQF